MTPRAPSVGESGWHRQRARHRPPVGAPGRHRWRGRELAARGRGLYSETAVEQRPEPRAIAYTSALLAVIIGIAHAALAPLIVIGGVKPDIILVAVVLVTATFGFSHGILWAFVGGSMANLLIAQPLGSVPLVLLVVAALVAGGARLIGRFSYPYPIVAALVASLVADALGLVIFSLVADAPRAGIPLELMLPAAVLNAAIAGLFVLPVRAVSLRVAPEESTAW